MCTVTWLHQDESYYLFCNRDEKKTRALAHGPALHRRDGVAFLAPTDGAAGGAWIGTNQFGISICLLNGRPKSDSGSRSRGLLLPELLSASSSIEARERVRSCELSTYAPFRLAILQPGRDTTVLEWDGDVLSRLHDLDSWPPLISSSFDPGGVQASRRAEFQRQLAVTGSMTAGMLTRFHRSHGANTDAYSTCMHRADAETVSFTSVAVTEGHIEMSYTAGAPCRSGLVDSVTLARGR